MPCGNTLSQIMTSVIMQSGVGLLQTVSETVSGLNSSQADNTMQHSQILVHRSLTLGAICARYIDIYSIHEYK